MADDLKNFIDSKTKEIFNNFSNKDCMVSKLQEINKNFITDYKIQINCNKKDLTIIPIETEIYFSRFSSKKSIKDDGMCHINELQKERFGQLYFHRKGISKDNKILCANSKTTWGGVDVCLSYSKDYCLSILIRSAFINSTTELVSGTRNICDKIKDICFDESKEDLQSFFEHLEENKDNIKKRNEKINIDNILSQPRINRDKYYEKVKEYELNCLNLGKYNDEYKYKYEYLQFIIDNKQTFYKKKENIDYILTKYQQKSTN